MNRWRAVALVSSVTAAWAGASLGGCNGSLPAQQPALADGGSTEDGSAIPDAATATMPMDGAAEVDVRSGEAGGESGAGSSSGGSGASTDSSSSGSSSGGTGPAGGSSGSSGSSSSGGEDAGDGSMAASDSSADGEAPQNDSSTMADVADATMIADSGYGGLGGSCITSLSGTYVQRKDGVLLWEGPPEEPILDSATGLPLAGVTSVEDGLYHGCAATSNGSVECWQTNAASGNYYGQLGNGTTTLDSVLYRATPVLMAANVPLTNVSSIATGNFADTACAVTNDGKLYCWGYLTWVVNNGTNLTSGYAQAITLDGMTPLTGVIQAAVGPSDACALVKGPDASTNEVWCWGYNGAGELGQGSTVSSQYPTKVLGLTNPTKVVLSAYQSDATVCVLDGSNVLCWGVNAGDGVAGVNSMVEPIQSPSLVVTQNGATLGGIADIESGGTEFSVLLSNGTIWTWGYGAAIYAANYGVTNVLAVGYGGGYGGGIRYLTSDGVYHNGAGVVTVDCSAL